MHRRITLIVLTSALALVGASTALGSHTGYWFYQGDLPTSSGARTVLHGDVPDTPIYVRANWSPCNHDMKAIIVDNGGSWGGFTFFYGFGCDQNVMDEYPEFHNNYGCQNPPNNLQVYVNCRAGTGV